MRCPLNTDTPWSSPSGSLMDDADLRDGLSTEELDWRSYVKLLPTRP